MVVFCDLYTFSSSISSLRYKIGPVYLFVCPLVPSRLNRLTYQPKIKYWVPVDCHNKPWIHVTALLPAAHAQPLDVTRWHHDITAWRHVKTFGQEYWHGGHVAGGCVNTHRSSIFICHGRSPFLCPNYQYLFCISENSAWLILNSSALGFTFEYIVTCQAHPVLVKIKRIKCAVHSFPPVDGPKDPWPRVLSLPRRFVGDPASLARDNIVTCQKRGLQGRFRFRNLDSESSQIWIYPLLGLESINSNSNSSWKFSGWFNSIKLKKVSIPILIPELELSHFVAV